ncbi:MAG: preprotein translocase subunit SecG [Omnitrophica WOR_2 bacterium RIFCSPHIGHO2_01_FULL_48_9]|nr:MAG: preprotein translocase subunit SecG [Omnitrophica WOR_2 bacterium RIFCSPHIGHO2_02_FULL_48_11]OGX33267.1 MAG: preprotein translocase subunit SecG [Omnitrophica WOR_2 bacterium RIFCSPHIGHO2_01_FULL_48_9]
MGFIFFIHAVAAILLVLVVLMQSGRGGGLTEGFASAESMFGAKTNLFMVRTTSVLAAIFIVTSLSLAFFSSRKDRSLMPQTMPIKGADGETLNKLLDSAESPEMPITNAVTDN